MAAQHTRLLPPVDASGLEWRSLSSMPQRLPVCASFECSDPAFSTSSSSSESSNSNEQPTPSPYGSKSMTARSLSFYVAPSILPPPNLHIQLPRPCAVQGADPEYPRPSVGIAHPYSRIIHEIEDGKKRRRWILSLEEDIFTREEISSLSATERRSIYAMTLEAHIECLHRILFRENRYPAKTEELVLWAELNPKTTKSLISGLRLDMSLLERRLHELERANIFLRAAIARESQHILETTEDRGS